LRILVIGATGGLGQDVVGAALAGGHETSALVRDPARAALLAPMVPDKERQEQVVRESGLEWLVRPGRFVRGKPRGALRVLRDGERGRLGHVARADLARFLVDCLVGDAYVGEAVVGS